MSQHLGKESLEKLRNYMKENLLDIFYISGRDPHFSEFSDKSFDIRPFISGFKGSSGDIFITLKEAFLWTDGRYLLQAKNQLYHGYKVISESSDFVSIFEWLLKLSLKKKNLGFDPLSTSIFFIDFCKKYLEKSSDFFSLYSCPNILEIIWTSRPSQQFQPLRLGANVSETPQNKIQNIRQSMKKQKVNHHIISSLEDIAWILNLRGQDLPFVEVFYAFLIISFDKILLFIDKKIFERSLIRKKDIFYNEIKILPYQEFLYSLKSFEGKILVDPSTTSYSIKENLSSKSELVFSQNPSSLLKLKKSSFEIQLLKSTHIQEAIHWLKLVLWLRSHLDEERYRLRESDVICQLKKIRSQNMNYLRESFSPIVGWAENGAVIHYQVSNETDKKLEGNSLLLVDTGAHYQGGTTDMTRVFSFGISTQQMKKDYTNVLKGLIRISSLIFLEGTTGEQIDILAREQLWREGLNYRHGTGHGVGFCLNVHEGPLAIRPKPTGIALEEGMVVSLEPGLYRENLYGIRLENLVCVKFCKKTEYGKFFKFDVLSLFPFEPNLIERELLSQKEIVWLCEYHKLVYNNLNSLLNEEEKRTLKEYKVFFRKLLDGDVSVSDYNF